MSTIDRMLAIAPVYLYIRDGVYHCNWTVSVEKGQCARGWGDSWAIAAYNAWKAAYQMGWVNS